MQQTSEEKPNFCIQDECGRFWCIKLDAPRIERVKQVLSIDLLAAVASPEQLGLSFSALLADRVAMTAVIYYICETQIERISVSPEEFGASLGADAFLKAWALICSQLAERSADPTVKHALNSLFA